MKYRHFEIAARVTRLGKNLPFGLPWVIFGGNNQPKKVLPFWANFLKQFFYIFMLIRRFRAWFVVGILSFEKCFGVDVLDFQIEVFSRYFGTF